MADQLTHEEHVLLFDDRTGSSLARNAPQWTPEQREVVSQRWAGLLEKLLASYPGRYEQQ